MSVQTFTITAGQSVRITIETLDGAQPTPAPTAGPLPTPAPTPPPTATPAPTIRPLPPGTILMDMPRDMENTGVPWDFGPVFAGQVLSYRFVAPDWPFMFSFASNTEMYGSLAKEAVLSREPGSFVGVDGLSPGPDRTLAVSWARWSRDVMTIRSNDPGMPSGAIVPGQTYYLNIRPSIRLDGTQQPAAGKIVVGRAA